MNRAPAAEIFTSKETFTGKKAVAVGAIALAALVGCSSETTRATAPQPTPETSLSESTPQNDTEPVGTTQYACEYTNVSISTTIADILEDTQYQLATGAMSGLDESIVAVRKVPGRTNDDLYKNVYDIAVELNDGKELSPDQCRQLDYTTGFTVSQRELYESVCETSNSPAHFNVARVSAEAQNQEIGVERFEENIFIAYDFSEPARKGYAGNQSIYHDIRADVYCN